MNQNPVMNVNIREAQANDAPAIVCLIRGLAATVDETSAITEVYAAKYLSSPAGRVLLAEGEGQIIGLLSYSLRPDLYHAGNSCLIEELIVRQDARGQGVGSTLLSELLSRLTRINCAEVSVAVMPDNQNAIRFYRRHGLTDEAVFLERHFV